MTLLNILQYNEILLYFKLIIGFVHNCEYKYLDVFDDMTVQLGRDSKVPLNTQGNVSFKLSSFFLKYYIFPFVEWLSHIIRLGYCHNCCFFVESIVNLYLKEQCSLQSWQLGQSIDILLLQKPAQHHLALCQKKRPGESLKFGSIFISEYCKQKLYFFSQPLIAKKIKKSYK